MYVVSLPPFSISPGRLCRWVEKAGQCLEVLGREWTGGEVTAASGGAGCSLGPSLTLGHFTKGHCICMENFPALNEATEAVRW